MGIMDIFTKKKKVSPKDEISSYFSSMEKIKNKELYEQLASFVAKKLLTLNFTDEAALKSFNDDKGLLDSLVFSATISSAYTKLKNDSPKEFIGVCGSNAFGRGIYVAEMQNSLNKPVSQFTINEVEKIIGAFRYSPDYEVGLRMIDVGAGSENHVIFNELIVEVAKFYLNNCLEPLEEENLRSYMQVLFNAGVTVAYK